MLKLTLAVPCYNEQGNIKAFFECVSNVFDKKEYEYEVLFVDDGSKDKTLDMLKEIYEQRPDVVSYVSFSRNFGKESAIYAALSHANGEYTAIIDGDLQQRPEYVAEMVDYLDSNPDYDCVAAYQDKRKESLLMSLCKKSFYKIMSIICKLELVPGASDFRTFRNNVKDALLEMMECHRFSKGLFAWVGFKTHYMPYEVEMRNAGKTTWNYPKLIKYALTGITAFTVKPLELSLYVGAFFTLAGIVGIVVFYILMASVEVSNINMFGMLMSFISMIGGNILVAIGIAGDYLSKIYIQDKNRPIFIEKIYKKRIDKQDE